MTITSNLTFCSIAINRVSQGIDLKDNIIVAAAGSFVLVRNLEIDGQSGVSTLKGHTKNVTAVSYVFDPSSQNYFIVSASADKSIIVWNFNEQANKWEIFARLCEHLAGVVALGTFQGEQSTSSLIFSSSDSANTIRIWELVSGSFKCIQVIQLGSHHSMSLALATLPKTNIPLMFSGDTDLKLNVYAKKSDKFEKILSLQGHTDWIRSIKVASYTETHKEDSKEGLKEGDLMIASASQDKYIRIWKVSEVSQSSNSVQSDDLLDAMSNMTMTNGQLSTKAHFIELLNNDEPLKYTFMLDTVLMGHDDWVFSVNWQKRTKINLDGKLVDHQPMSLVSASADKTVIIWKPDLHSETWIPKNRVGEVGGTTLGFYGGIFSEDGSRVYSNGYNGAIHGWEWNSSSTSLDWTPLIGTSGHFASVEWCQWDPTGSYLLSTSLDQTSRIISSWKNGNKTTWHEIGRPQIHGYNLQCFAFTNKYQYVSGADEKVVRVFDAPKTFAQTLQSLTTIPESEDIINERPIGANLPALGLSNKAVFEGEAPNASVDNRLSAYTAETLAASLSSALTQPPFEEHLLSNTLWPETQKLYGHGYEIIATAASKDGSMVATACKASKTEHAGVRLWCTSKWIELCAPLDFHSLTVTTIKFSNCNRYLLTAGRDRSWALFDLEKVKEEKKWTIIQSRPKAHARIIWSSSFSFDDKLFVTGSRDKSLKIWGSINGAYDLVETVTFKESVTAVDLYSSLIESNYVLAVGLENGDIFIIRFSLLDNKITVNENTPLNQADTHNGTVKSVSWRPNQSDTKKLELISCSEDFSVRMYSITL
ncbi:WD40-repeat-containing domain protein [Globomyces pollinis-pini]|nr:WD40-repeat-containing domain protein [Globomyces pollinis-pini]